MSKTAKIKKDVRPYAGRVVTVLGERIHPNGRKVVKLVIGQRSPDAGKWTQEFGRYAQNILEYSPDELQERSGADYEFGSLLDPPQP